MLLSNVLERLRDESFAAETLVGLDDLPLVAGISAEAGRHGETAGDYAAAAVRRFAAFADDEDWLALIAAIERGADPGATALRYMLAWCLHHDCDCPHHRGECLT